MISQSPRRTNALFWVLPCILPFFATGVSVAEPVTTSLPAVADTTLRRQQANQNRGGDEQARLGWAQTSRALVRFDPAAIAAAVGAGTLISAHLEFEVEATGESWFGGSQNIGAHRLTAAWTEIGATWNCAIDARPGDNRADCYPLWNGGSFLAAATATMPHTKETRGLVRFDVTSDVAAFLAGTANHGWLLKKENEALSGRIDYVSREGVAAARAPRLVVTFETAVTDTTSPMVTITSPARDAILSTGTPTISVNYSDAGSGIDPASVRLVLDGVERTAEAQVTVAGVSWTPAQPLGNGRQEAEVSVADLAGNTARASWGFLVDTVPPSLNLFSPPEELLSDNSNVQVGVLLGDATSGIDPASFRLTVDGVVFQASCPVIGETVLCRTPPLASGEHLFAAEIRDRAGHPATASKQFRFTLDHDPPVLTVLAPADGSSVKEPVATVTGMVADDSRVTSVEVNGVPATLSAQGFSLQVQLQPGLNGFLVVATDAMGRQSEVLSRVRLDNEPPVLKVESPPKGAASNFDRVLVEGEISDRSEIVSFSIAGSPVPVTAGRFAAEVALAEGQNTFALRAEDAAGNVTTETIEIARFTLPEVLITAPEDLGFIPQTTIDVTGTVSDPGAVVEVNGILGSVSGTSFIVREVPLIEGGNVLTATARDSRGRIGTHHIQVVRDTTVPRLAVHSPRDGETVFEPAVTVAGMVNDLVAGTVNLADATVTVNGLAADVANRSFLATDVPLAPGENVLEIEAVDAGGNVGRATVRVTLGRATVARVRRVSGDLQSGTAGSLLPEPLRVQLLDAAGLPVAGKPVLFKVRGNNGSLAGGKRHVAVPSDENGFAETPFRLGTRSGAGNQEVEASAVGFAGPVRFHATALAGSPALIVVDSGDQQVGIAGQTLPRPLVAVVTDSGYNRLPGVAVRFEIVQGEGRLDNGAQETVVTTDSDGRAIASLRLEPVEGIGNNVVEARIVSLPEGPAAGFTASGWTAGDPAETVISGVVLDNSNQPIPGATLRIKGHPHTARTNAAGVFRITGAPVSTLYLIVDGSTVERPGSWPDLEFVVTTIAGRDNHVGMPIYLLPLDLANGVPVDETRGGTLRLPDVPGFALEIAPGSVTFPSGSRSGFVSVTVVHADKVPMVPNFGQQPRLIVTIQPAGARFEPPAQLTLPNLEGLAPGEVTEFYSFDHDLGHFVSIGPATVSEDGTVITSNPGVGIIKAGWHCGDTPGFTGSTHDCPRCHSCLLNTCTPDDAQPCELDGSEPCKVKPTCQGGFCVGQDVIVEKIQKPCFGEVGQPVKLTAIVKPEEGREKIEWQAFPDANPPTGSGGSFMTTFASEGYKPISAGCPTGQLIYDGLQVYPTCGDVQVLWNRVFGIQSVCFGRTVPVSRQTERGNKCVRSNQICLALKTLQINYIRDVPLDCDRIDIPSAEAVTEGTCDKVIADLTPSAAGSPFGPPREVYWVSRISEEHEAFHESQHLRPLVEQGFVPAVRALLQEGRWCSDGCGPMPSSADLEAEIDRLWTKHVSEPWAAQQQAHEIEAYDRDRLKYFILIDSIRERARVMGWSTCQTPPGGAP